MGKHLIFGNNRFAFWGMAAYLFAMCRFCFFFMLTALTFVAASACQKSTSPSSENNTVSINELNTTKKEGFVIDGIRLGSTAEFVKSKLGNPILIKADYLVCGDNNICEYWDYEDTRIYIDNGEVWGMSTQSTRMCLFDEICPGQNIKNVFNRLGVTKLWPASRDKPPRLEYGSSQHEACWLWVFLDAKTDIIQELRLACQP